ncbi:MAG TPA: hypothetical protein VFJ06_00860 [Halococcus sp.]|nr:hypothetical protein [Halococcus sp.]
MSPIAGSVACCNSKELLREGIDLAHPHSPESRIQSIASEEAVMWAAFDDFAVFENDLVVVSDSQQPMGDGKYGLRPTFRGSGE